MKNLQDPNFKPQIPRAVFLELGTWNLGLGALLFLIPHTSSAQQDKAGTFLFQGVVYGYNYDPSKKLLLQKNKPFVMEGLLRDVSINIYDNNKLMRKDKTNINGEFSVLLPLNGIFKLELSKEGYDKNILGIDTKNIPKEKTGQMLAFTGAEFMLNSFAIKEEVKPESMGRLYYDKSKGYFEFLVNFKRSKKAENPVELIKKAVLKNKISSSAPSLKNTSAHVKASSSSASSPDSSVRDTYAYETKEKSAIESWLSPAGIENITPENMILRKNEIENARAQLEKDKLHTVSKEDSILISVRETVLHVAEVELQNALKLIEVQKYEIHHKKRELYITAGLLGVLSGFSVVLYIYYRDKKRTNRLLKTQNTHILDSITYAKRIQQSILIDEEEIKKILPDSFIYYQPKDIVSGDFYWFSQMNDKIFIAVVDCTGHGVPGAFMSLIANTLLNKIVNEKGISDPAHILKRLHTDIAEALQQEKDPNSSHDGMDMALCVIDQGKNKIKYAGAINPLYIVYDGALEVIKADMHCIGGRKLRGATDNTRKFTTHTIPIRKGMCLYMFSDGYLDQFGGPSQSPQWEGRRAIKKFGTERFKNLLLKVNVHDMNWQKDIVEETMNEWRGNYRQIDDMLVLGIRT